MDMEEEEFNNTVLKIVDDVLTWRENQIIKLRFGFFDKKHTRSEVAKMFAVTIERIRGVERKALRKLKRHMEKSINKINLGL